MDLYLGGHFSLEISAQEPHHPPSNQWAIHGGVGGEAKSRLPLWKKGQLLPGSASSFSFCLHWHLWMY